MPLDTGGPSCITTNGDGAMPFQAVPNGREITVVGLQNGVPIINIIHTSSSTSATLENLESIADAVITWVQDSVLPETHPSYVLQMVKVRDISSSTGLAVEIAPATSSPGEAGGTAAAANASIVASLRTGVQGRSFRGRIYFGGLAQQTLTNAQTMGVSSAAAYATMVTDLIDVLTAVGQTLSVLSRVADGVQRVTGILTEVIQVIVNTKVDSQRRRTAN